MLNDSSIWGDNYASFILLNVGAALLLCRLISFVCVDGFDIHSNGKFGSLFFLVSYSMILGRASELTILSDSWSYMCDCLDSFNTVIVWLVAWLK